MEIFKYFKPHINPPPPSVTSPQSYSTDRLTKLPSELFITILALLPPVDRACLGLCDRRLHAIFERYYRFPTLRDEKLSLFIRLERDLPEYFACDICNFLHRYDGSESFGLSGIAHFKSCQLPCIRKGYDWRAECLQGSSITMGSHLSFSYIKNRLYFFQVKLAMRRYWYGPTAGINTDSLAFTQVHQYRHPRATSESSVSCYENIKMLFSMDAQICPDPLGVYIRMQDILIYDIWEDSQIRVDSHTTVMSLYKICPHLLLENKASEVDSVYNGETDSFSYTCPDCNIVSLIEFRRIDSTISLVMTRWVYLGTGISREDPLWKIHIFNSSDGSMPLELPPSLMTHSPRACFENTTSLSLKALTSRNISYLRGGRYKKGAPFALGMQGGPFWHISYKEPSRLWSILSAFS